MFTEDNRRFTVINAFALERFGGNPAAVFPQAEGLTQGEMQLIARQLNLVETVFVFNSSDPKVDRELRYFTPIKELPIAGHPTIATWIALTQQKLVSQDGRSSFVQQNRAGIQRINIEERSDRIAVYMEQPTPRYLETISDRGFVSGVFGLKIEDLADELPVRAVDTGLGHLIVPVKSLDSLMRAKRQVQALKELCDRAKVREVQMFCFETYNPDFDFHTRNLCPREGLEDPACGVGNGALGAYLAKHGCLDDSSINLRFEQGYITNMPSLVEVKAVLDGDEVKVLIGGTGVVMLTGVFEMDE